MGSGAECHCFFLNEYILARAPVRLLDTFFGGKVPHHHYLASASSECFEPQKQRREVRVNLRLSESRAGGVKADSKVVAIDMEVSRCYCDSVSFFVPKTVGLSVRVQCMR